jgi:hypothetical protein
MTVLTERIHTAEWLISEGNSKFSRDVVTVTVPSQTLMPSGTVLGKITATGKYIPSLNAASDGSQVAVAVLYNELPAQAAGDVKATVIVRQAEVFGAMLNNGAALETGAAAELTAAGIVVR